MATTNAENVAPTLRIYNRLFHSNEVCRFDEQTLENLLEKWNRFLYIYTKKRFDFFALRTANPAHGLMIESCSIHRYVFNKASFE